MKSKCEGCGSSLLPTGEAYFCSYECTFCPACFFKHQACPNCGGELVRRPKRLALAGSPADPAAGNPPSAYRWGLVWAISLGVWTFVALADSLAVWQLYRATDSPMRFMTTLWLQLTQMFGYAVLTPFVFALAIRYPMRRDNWLRRSLFYLAAGCVFCVLHIGLRAVTPYGVWDPKSHAWVSGVWDAHAHVFRILWPALGKLVLYNLVDDITGTFVPILMIAHAIAYYRKFQERKIRATQLEGQLSKAHLHSLKSQLQPHFLFNTLHSISSLMLTDVQAADRMITRLGDLLRMSLESEGTQITTLSRELDFVNCYLEIEKIRFEERLNIVFDIAPETVDAQVPLLLLQPLVDNAVKHGISRLPDGGEIHISTFTKNGNLQLEVRDNGPGLFSPENGRGAGLGLRLTRERLETLYGENQSVELTSSPTGGVAVFVSIPLRSSSAMTERIVPHRNGTRPLQHSEVAS
jgi:two-component system LytT family sensor kinase